METYGWPDALDAEIVRVGKGANYLFKTPACCRTGF
jgi:hypothetical protein